jgi:hypothetical protein
LPKLAPQGRPRLAQGRCPAKNLPEDRPSGQGRPRRPWRRPQRKEKSSCAKRAGGGVRAALRAPRPGRPNDGLAAAVSATLRSALARADGGGGRSCFGDEFRSRFNGQVPAVDICRYPPRPWSCVVAR